MGFFDKVIRVFESKKENVKSSDSDENSVDDELINKPTFTESIESDNGNLLRFHELITLD